MIYEYFICGEGKDAEWPHEYPDLPFEVFSMSKFLPDHITEYRWVKHDGKTILTFEAGTKITTIDAAIDNYFLNYIRKEKLKAI